MSSIRRTAEEIKQDFGKIKEAASTARSISDIVRMTGLTRQQVMTTIEKFPNESEKILKKLDINQPSRNNCNSTVNKTFKKAINSVKKYVIDASITASENLSSVLEEILESDSKIVITQITRSELAKIQRYNYDPLARHDARRLLDICASMPEKVESVRIDESAEIHDLCIIEYCRQNNHNLVLLTGDKEMAIDARSYGIETTYLRKAQKRVFTSASETPNISETVENVSTSTKADTATTSHNTFTNFQTTNLSDITPIEKYDTRTWTIGRTNRNKLVINNFHDSSTSIRVFSGSLEYDEGPYDLRVGDEVMIATLTPQNTIDFKIFKVSSLSEVGNCKLIFSKTLFPNSKRINLPTYRHKAFISSFKVRHALYA